MIKVFTYFVEPASYTLDLIKNIHSKLGITYIFIKNMSEAKSITSLDNNKSLSEKLFFSKIIFVYNIWKNNNLIVVNGYNNYPFILTFIFNIFSFNKKHIAIESDTQLKIPKNILKRIIKNIYLNIIFRNKYVLGFAGGSKTHKDLFLHYGMKVERIFLIPMMIDNQKYYQEEVLFPEQFTFLFVGRLIDTKNVDSLCDRFLSSFSDKNAKLIIVGDGDNLNQYKKDYSHEKIIFKGSVFGKELIDIYHNASVFVFPSSVESWGLVVNEAMSAALPIVAHKEVGSVHDFIHNKETGFVIDNWEEMECKMLELYNNPDLCKQFSENSERLMKEYWNYNLYENNLLESIKKVKEWV